MVHILYNLADSRDTDRLAKLNSPLFNLQLAAKDELGKVRSLTKSDIPFRTEFFLQNEVEKFAKDIGEMSNLIRTRLYALSTLEDQQKPLQDMEADWQVAGTQVTALINAYDEMTRIDQQVTGLRKEKNTLKKQTDVIRSTEYQQLQRDIEGIANSVSSFDTYEKEYKRISFEVTALIKSIGRLDWQNYEGHSILQSLSADLTNRNIELQAAFQAAKKKFDDAKHTTQLNDKKAVLKAFLKAKGLSPENIGEVAAATQRIAELEEEVKTLQQERTPYQEIYERKDNILQTYKTAYSSYKQSFERVANSLQSDLRNLKFDEKEARILFDFKINDQALKNQIAEFVKSHNTSKITLRSDTIQSVFFGNDKMRISDLIADKTKIIDAINTSEGADVHTEIIADLVSQADFVERLHLRMQQYHYDIHNIQVQTKLGEKALQNTSFGERCGIVIAIVLVAGTNPIIIDQPEDNLDGKYISLVLVPLLRSQKRKRQIILVTRDANICIGGDSDLILILEKNDRGTVLLPSTIENKELRQRYIWILDGGEAAFKNREAKYCIPKLI